MLTKRNSVVSYLKSNRQTRVTCFAEHLRGGDPIVDHEEYKEIVEVFFTVLTNAMINTGGFFKAPVMMGCIGIEKRKIIDHPILDFNHMWKTGEVRKVVMSQQDGFAARFRWLKNQKYMRLMSKNTIKFVPSRYAKKLLNTTIKTTNCMAHYPCSVLKQNLVT